MTEPEEQTIWDRLQIEGEDVGQYVRLRYPRIAACPTYAARRTPSGHEVIILEVDKNSIPAGIEYPDSRGFSIDVIPLEEGRSGSTRLVLSLTDPVYRDVFLSLAYDVATVLASAQTERQAVQDFVSRLGRWQAFLRRHGPEGLSAEAKRGLFGELVVLRDLLLPAVGGDAVAFWKGPEGAAHDFQLPGGSIEVKSTVAATPGEFRVSNVLQLDDSLSKALFVVLVLLQEGESQGETLPDLVSSLRSTLSGEVLGQLDDRLIDVGYLDRHAHQYSSPRYHVRSRRFFKVDEGFPRIVSSIVSEGVIEVSYSVAVAACLPYVCEEDAVLSFILGHGDQ